MKKIINLLFIVFYFMFNNTAQAFEEQSEVTNTQKELKPDVLLTMLNTIVLTAQSLQSGSDSAPDVSPACEKVGEGPIKSLNSRTSFCQKFEQEFDLYNAQAQNAYVNTVKIIGYVYTEEDNPTNTLDFPVKFKFRSTYTNPAGPYAQIAPRLECGTTGGVLDCQQIGGMPSVVLNPGLSNEVLIQTRMNMDNRDDSRYLFEGMEIRANYNIAGQLIDMNSPNLSSDKIPVVRCDVNQARSNSKGCIFQAAPAVLTRINVTNPDVDESALHIRDAQNSGLPGKYVPQQDSILPTAESKPLKRLRDLAKRRDNRKESLNQCLAKFNTYSPTCAASGDPEDPEVDCDCDEFPFAATQEGAANPKYPVSVRKIDPSDNRRAGAYLGVFYTQQRVLDEEEFYINVE